MGENLRPEDICQDWMERAQNAEYLVTKLETRLRLAERVVEAAVRLYDRERKGWAPSALQLDWRRLGEALSAWKKAKRDE